MTTALPQFQPKRIAPTPTPDAMARSIMADDITVTRF